MIEFSEEETDQKEFKTIKFLYNSEIDQIGELQKFLYKKVKFPKKPLIKTGSYLNILLIMSGLLYNL